MLAIYVLYRGHEHYIIIILLYRAYVHAFAYKKTNNIILCYNIIITMLAHEYYYVTLQSLL